MLTSTSSSTTPIKRTSLRQPPQRVSIGTSTGTGPLGEHETVKASPTSPYGARPEWNVSSSPLIDRSRKGLKPAVPSSTTPFKASQAPHETHQLRGNTKGEKTTPNTTPKGAGILLGFGASSNFTTAISHTPVQAPRKHTPTTSTSFYTDLDNASRDLLLELVADSKQKIATLELDVKVQERQIRDLEEMVENLQISNRNETRALTDLETILSRQLVQERQTR